jgi:hypothetical protein
MFLRGQDVPGGQHVGLHKVPKREIAYCRGPRRRGNKMIFCWITFMSSLYPMANLKDPSKITLEDITSKRRINSPPLRARRQGRHIPLKVPRHILTVKILN